MYAFNPKPFSYSSLKKFETCPRQYSEIVVHRNYKDVYTSTNGEYGDRLHKAADSYVQNGGDIDAEFQFIRPVLDIMRSIPGEKLTEHRMAVKIDGTPTKWNDPDRWFQGIADLAVVGESPIARCCDWKTGNVNYADTDQLELMALLLFANFPHIKFVKGALVFVLSEQVRKRDVDITERDTIWQKYRERDAKRVAAIAANNFPMKESGLCRKHCPILTCEMNGKR